MTNEWWIADGLQSREIDAHDNSRRPTRDEVYRRTDALSRIVDVQSNRNLRSSELDQRPNRSESSDCRRHVPERPPVFSQSARSPIVIERSIDLHMS